MIPASQAGLRASKFAVLIARRITLSRSTPSATMANKGIAVERKVKLRLKSEGWWVIRAAASLGDADVVALKAGEATRFIEVKANKDGGPYKNFSRDDRYELIKAAIMAGAIPELCYWPPGQKEPQWIPSGEWPGAGEMTRRAIGELEEETAQRQSAAPLEASEPGPQSRSQEQ